ncbi:Fungal specific transcription factor domain-containing protein [Cladophialophora immunda]|nr:Fungal specific transcription factor domain-containing protein [Cladophialophora immunda]
MTRPICKTCTIHSRECVYSNLPPKPRPSKALIRAAETRKRALELLLIKLKQCPEEQRHDVLASFEVLGNSVKVVDPAPEDDGILNVASQTLGSPLVETNSGDVADSQDMSDDEDDETLLTEHKGAEYLSLDEHGQIGAFGPTSALHDPVESPSTGNQPLQNLANQLFVNAALQRQFESTIWSFSDIDGVPIELATHLHDLHWNRQHHTFLLTYRPLYTRDLISGGPYWSKFLSNAIFASASKFSNRPEVRDNPNDPRTSGGRFLRRCEELLVEESPFEQSSIPTAARLMLLSSTFLARSEVSKGWKYGGLVIRMIFDLSLHLDCERPSVTTEDIEIRQRVF